VPSAEEDCSGQQPVLMEADDEVAAPAEEQSERVQLTGGALKTAVTQMNEGGEQEDGQRLPKGVLTEQ